MWRLIKHAGEGNRENEEVKGMYKVQEKNVEGQEMDSVKRMEMAVVNTYFKKRRNRVNRVM